jgi:hypothetical protein
VVTAAPTTAAPSTFSESVFVASLVPTGVAQKAVSFKLNIDIATATNPVWQQVLFRIDHCLLQDFFH